MLPAQTLSCVKNLLLVLSGVLQQFCQAFCGPPTVARYSTFNLGGPTAAPASLCPTQHMVHSSLCPTRRHMAQMLPTAPSSSKPPTLLLVLLAVRRPCPLGRISFHKAAQAPSHRHHDCSSHIASLSCTAIPAMVKQNPQGSMQSLLATCWCDVYCTSLFSAKNLIPVLLSTLRRAPHAFNGPSSVARGSTFKTPEGPMDAQSLPSSLLMVQMIPTEATTCPSTCPDADEGCDGDVAIIEAFLGTLAIATKADVASPAAINADGTHGTTNIDATLKATENVTTIRTEEVVAAKDTAAPLAINATIIV